MPNDRARLRFFVASTHTEAELDATVRLVVEAMRDLANDDAGESARRGTADERTREVPA